MTPDQAFTGMDPDKVLSLAKRCLGAAAFVRDAARDINAIVDRVHPGEAAPYVTPLNDFAVWLEGSAADLTARATKIATIQAIDRFPLINFNIGEMVPLPAHRFASAAEAENKVKELLGKDKHKPKDVIEDPGKLEKLSREVAKYASDPNFAAAFVKRFGAERLVEVPRTLQAWEYQRALVGSHDGMYHEHYRQNRKYMEDDPENVKGILYSFSAVLATATHSADASTRREVKKVAKDDDAVALSWLMSPDDLVFDTDFLLDAFQNGVVDRIVDENLNATNTHYRESYALGGMDGRGLPLDPKVKILEALSRDSDAALQAVQKNFGKPGLELRRSGLGGTEDFRVEAAFDLLFHHGTYDDKGAALGRMMSAANDRLHEVGTGDPAKVQEADILALRLSHEVTEGRKEIDLAVRGLSEILAKHHIDDLHGSAKVNNPDEDFGKANGGYIGAIIDTGIVLSKPQVENVMAAIMADEAASDAFYGAVVLHQAKVIEEGTRPGAPPGMPWVIELAAFEGLLVNAMVKNERGDFDERLRRREFVVDLIDTVASFIPGGQLKSLVTSPSIDVVGKAKEGLLPAPSWDESVADINKFRYQTWQSTRALVVNALYESGQLGPREEVVKTMEEVLQARTSIDKVSRARTVPRYMADDGALVPYGRLEQDQRDAFNAWVEDYLPTSPAASDALAKADDAYHGRIDELDKG